MEKPRRSPAPWCVRARKELGPSPSRGIMGLWEVHFQLEKVWWRGKVEVEQEEEMRRVWKKEWKTEGMGEFKKKQERTVGKV